MQRNRKFIDLALDTVRKTLRVQVEIFVISTWEDCCFCADSATFVVTCLMTLVSSLSKSVQVHCCNHGSFHTFQKIYLSQ